MIIVLGRARGLPNNENRTTEANKINTLDSTALSGRN
jgi:hypothetical protein